MTLLRFWPCVFLLTSLPLAGMASELPQLIDEEALALELEALPPTALGPASGGAGQLSCLLEPSQVVDLSSAVSGVVKQVNTERGDRVRQGQVLLELHDGIEQAQLETARAKAEFARRKMQRNQELLEKKLLSDFEQDEIRTELRLAQLEQREAREQLKQRTILSPINGVVVNRHASVGEYVGSDPLMRLVALSPLYAEVILPAQHYGRIGVGDQVEVEVEGAGQGLHAGRVVIVDQIIDAASSTFGIRIEVPNEALSLPAGLKCRVHFAAL